MEYANTAINQALSKASLQGSLRISDFIGHGSFVAQCAVGNGQTGKSSVAPKYIGAAPEASIVFVVLAPIPVGPVSYNPKQFGDALNYIFSIAGREKKPCVINLSWGEQLTPADGTGPLDKIIDGVLNDSSGTPIKGRAIVVSAGNEGNARRHTRMSYPANGSLTVNMVVEPIGSMADDNQGDFIQIWYTGTSSIDITVIAPSPSKNIGPVSPGTNKVGSFVSIISSGISPTNNKKSILIAIKPNGKPVERGSWKIKLTETSGNAGLLDVWIGRKEDEVYMQMEGLNFVRDNTVTSPATSKSAISVGAYGTINFTRWRMMSASSWGDDNTTGLTADQIHPTITAPGMATAPAVGQLQSPAFLVLFNKVPIYWDSLPLARLGGTSFSSPSLPV